ncbi:isocitrate lyase/phosphoenolpyruvate mutase family protein [Nocardioides sp. T2.26MG-1]|uniref:isocitrate lyase/phosphoenolpyruvate mutase family protein n=1 Tax=Nocardioides sp. T2.26MG-1 TaxID=3041166 RepID=UPI002477C1C1|nr:isocitrate lyase/phosphoenolpyruvate mutase family protein [Nocardioides sp. T2.26MG-1]CAI9404342.1 hypothetical protein HIDPHFAB_04160 [Nocardioides sp. T2.26MG-1]
MFNPRRSFPALHHARLPLLLPAAKVAAVKDLTPDVFGNARVDTYWCHEDDTVPATVVRAPAYVEAGADGVVVPAATTYADAQERVRRYP